MKDKQGNTITAKEFFRRWGEGIKQMTPMQITRINLLGSVLVIVGILIGLYATFGVTWWLFIILSGSLLLAAMGFIAQIKAYLQLKMIELITKQQDTKEVAYV